MDYCTMYPEGGWAHCCKSHDRRYASTRLTKLQADILLYRCVKKVSVVNAVIMFVGVSVFGHCNYYKAQMEAR